MMKALLIGGILVVGVALAWWLDAINFFSIDRCQDEGGVWDYATEQCEK